MAQIRIDAGRCRGCGLCAQDCPTGCLTWAGSGPAVVARPETCIACGHCVALCPSEAITHAELPASKWKPYSQADLPDTDAVMALLRARRSVRHFREQRIDPAHWAVVLEGAALAPSAHNVREVRLVVIEDPERLHRIVQATAKGLAGLAGILRNPFIRVLGPWVAGPQFREGARLSPEIEGMVQAVRQGEDPILHRAPGLLLAHAEVGSRFAETDCALAMHSATLAGEAVGVSGFYVGWVIVAAGNSAPLRALLGIPAGHRLYGGMAFGYPALRYQRLIERPLLPVTRM